MRRKPSPSSTTSPPTWWKPKHPISKLLLPSPIEFHFGGLTSRGLSKRRRHTRREVVLSSKAPPQAPRGNSSRSGLFQFGCHASPNFCKSVTPCKSRQKIAHKTLEPLPDEPWHGQRR